ncbi:MAG: hypothetical protein ACP5MU_06805, partial [Thermoplasmata archaeon]
LIPLYHSHLNFDGNRFCDYLLISLFSTLGHACKISGQPFLHYMMKTSFMNVSIGPGWRLPSLPFPHTRINIGMQSDHKAGAGNEHS